ncbi:MAG: hypothetical protein BWY61_02188 [Firmicutes bacterium ADurb.Bin354]|nr:MAG: hypothetical protein BWY61_02188 [Firmicutes bacterium ADurb.Bin354]
MIREIPLPIPRSVICSPSHIRIIVPVVIVTAVTMKKPMPASADTIFIPLPSPDCFNHIAIPADWKRQSTTVRYFVYFCIFLLPSAPSFFIFSRAGTTMVISWRMIDAEIYGMIPSEKTVKRLNAPPAKRSK